MSEERKEKATEGGGRRASGRSAGQNTPRSAKGYKRGRRAPRERGHLRGLCVQDVDRVTPPGDAEDRGVVKVLAELLCVEGGGGDEELDVGPEAGDVLHEAEQYVCVEGPLVCLVHHHHLQVQLGLQPDGRRSSSWEGAVYAGGRSFSLLRRLFQI